MKSWFGCLSVLVLMVMGSCVFVIAQRMHHAENELQKLNRNIAQEQDHLRVLQAEWTYLNNPDRLEKLATTLLGLQPVDGKQYVATRDMPTRAAMDAIDVASGAKDDDDTQRQQLAARNVPVDDQAVDKALTLAASTHEAAPLSDVMPASMTVDALGDINQDGVE